MFCRELSAEVSFVSNDASEKTRGEKQMKIKTNTKRLPAIGVLYNILFDQYTDEIPIVAGGFFFSNPPTDETLFGHRDDFVNATPVSVSVPNVYNIMTYYTYKVLYAVLYYAHYNHYYEIILNGPSSVGFCIVQRVPGTFTRHRRRRRMFEFACERDFSPRSTVQSLF